MREEGGGGDRNTGSEMDRTMAAGASSQVALPLVPGALFAGRYRVEHAIGQGGMGAVYRVHDERLDEVVALKLLTIDHELAADRFVREVRLARRVTHPNVARTHDFGEEGGQSFLTMEFVAGEDLASRMRREGPCAPTEAVHIADQIAAGLEAAHLAGVIHRDLKPANVMIAEGGRVLLTDFGIARASQVDPGLTSDFVGTPLYMSPEQVSGQPVDGRSDLYALGLILYELLTGSVPFGGDSPVAVAMARLTQPPPDPAQAKPGVPPTLAALVRRCLALDPGERPASAAELRGLLAHWRSGSTGAAAPTGAEARARSASGAGAGASVETLRPVTSGLYAPMAVGRALAVLPFGYRGAADRDYLGEGVSEELVDVLSRTRGLRVLALGATRRFSDDRDPARLRSELEADLVVDGTVQLSGGQVRITARLVDTALGVQRWTERFEGRMEDVFAFQERMGRRIAEALRLEVDASVHGARVPEDAVAAYLRARRLLRGDNLGRGGEALELLEQCLEIAPDFAPALASHAMASVRVWWTASVALTEPGAPAEAAAASVARAVERASDVAETHLARAMLATQSADLATAAESLARALDIAPTLAEAHHYLGELQVEAGRHDEGMRRLQLALELDPGQPGCRYTIARCDALRGDYAGARRAFDELEATFGPMHLPLTVSRVRLALYERDLSTLAELRDRLQQVGGTGLPLASQLALLLGERSLPEVAAERRAISARIHNVRFAALVCQIAVEAFTVANELDEAMAVLEEAAAGALFDVRWLDELPLLEPLRTRPEFAAAAAQVRARAAAVWRR